MRVLIVTNHFWPEDFRINDLALGLTALGQEVTVFTAIPDYPQGHFHEGYGLFKKRREDWRGIRIVRFPLTPRGGGGRSRLAIQYASSALMSCLQIPFFCRDDYDIIFVFETSPVTIGLPAVLLRRLRRIPVVFWILDLWPESLSATGAITSKSVLGLVKPLVRFIYRRCDRILISSRGFAKQIRSTGGYAREPIYFPNWVEPEYLSDSAPESAAKTPRLPAGFRIVFAGNIGAAQDFPTILSAAEILRDRSDIQWIILGDGRQAAWVREQVKRRQLGDQVHLLGRFPATSMPAFFAQADALLLTLRREPIFALTVPGKLQSYLASGKPILAALDGEGASLVEESRSGFRCPAENPEQLAAQVLKLQQTDPAERQAMGDRARAYCREHFDRSRQFRKLLDLMEEVAEAGSR